MKIKINPLFFLNIILCFVFSEPIYFIISYITLVGHELIHLYFLYKNKVAAESITIEPFGISIKTKTVGEENIGVYLSAPFFNIVLSLIFYIIFKKTANSYFLIFSASNFLTGAFNLIPILPFDGGRAVMCFIKKKRIFVFISLLGGIFITFTGVILFLKSGFNFSLIMAGCFIIANSISENEQLFYRSLFLSKNRCLREIKEKTETKILTVPCDFGVHSLITSFDKRYFYMVNIIEDGILLKTVTEKQLIDGLLEGKRQLKDFI